MKEVKRIDNKIRWSKNRILSYNKLFSFVVGARAIGKTFACKRWAIDDYIKKGTRTAWLMRWRTEIDDATKDSKFFDDIIQFYPNYMFKIEGNTGELKYVPDGVDPKTVPWERFITFKALSERALKAISDPTVDKLIFDEFIPLVGIPYLPKEVDRFLEYYFTIARDRPMRAVFLSNNVTTVCPYFTYFNVKLPKEGDIAVYDEIVIENCKNQPFKEAMRQTRFGKLVQGTAYADYAIENKTLVDLQTFVIDRPKNAKCVVYIKTQMGDLFLWSAPPFGIFVSKQGDKSVMQWAFDDASHNEQSERVDYAGSLAVNLLKRAYRYSNLFFDSPDAKAVFQATISQILQR